MDGDIDWLFKDVFRRLALVLENIKNQKQREQIQLVIEGVGAIKKMTTPKEKRPDS